MVKIYRNIEAKQNDKCVICRKKAIVSMPYGPHKFCSEHFQWFFEKRVRKTIRLNKLIKGREKIAVGVSGGKDSLTTLYFLNKIFGKSNEVIALMVDEGISGYRDNALKIAKKNCNEWGIDYEVVKLKNEMNISMTEVMNSLSEGDLEQSACSYCGVFRRDLLNKKAFELKAKKIATGHNLDDECQSIIMNIASNDLPRLARLGPITGVRKISKFVPRIKPLYDSPENEVKKFAELTGIDFCKLPCCPFSWMAKRNIFRKCISEMEEKMPGTMFSIIASFKTMKPMLEKQYSKGKIKICAECGGPTNSDLCMPCSQLKRLKSLIGKR